MKICYVASPIDLVPDEEVNSLVAAMRGEAKMRLQENGWTVYDPAYAWWIGHGQQEPDSRLWRVNEMALQCAEALLAVYPEEAKSTGVPMEIEWMRGKGPVAVCGNRQWSFALRAPGIKLFGGKEAVKEAVEWLESRS